MPHTPGPWARNISPKYPVYAESDHRKVAVALNGHDISESEAMANLKLIAAAPDLLDALQKTLAQLLYPVEGPNAVNVAHEVVKQARATIAKATGE